MDDLDEAIAEAYASAPADTVWSTIELNHPTFDVPARFVIDHGELISEEPEVWGRLLKLEDDAPINPGETVTFIAAAIEVTAPAYKEGQQPEMSLSIDNVSGKLVPLLKEAISVGEAMSVYARQYRAADPDTVSWRLRGLYLRRVTASLYRVEGKASFSDLRERVFGLTYTKPRFPSLGN